MKALIGCEESQVVCMAFRERGHEAYSCDIQPCSGGHPEFHLQMDVFEAIKLKKWDIGIFFPPCTYLCTSGLHWNNKRAGREKQTILALEFVNKLLNCNIPKIAIENPPGRINTAIKKPTQIVHPYYFGDEAQKTTCLWLIGLPKLLHFKQTDLFNNEITHTGKGEMMKCVRKNGKIQYQPKWNQGLPPSKDRAKIRSKTFPGIAKAMADQWG